MKRFVVVLVSILICGNLISCMGGKRPGGTHADRVHVTSYESRTTTQQPVNEEIPQDVPRLLEIPIAAGVQEQIIEHVGYTVSFNSQTRLPNWVAYELTYAEANGTFPRDKRFNQDPYVRGMQADNDDYKNSGWDKGHMCPAGDAKWSKQAMSDSFYFTNICPQNPNLNGGDWKDLEEKCRAITQFYGKVYIVCGAIVGDAINGTLGYNRVTIPDAFYKVLLVETSKGYEGIGFYFENKAGQKSLGNYARSIDYIEQITNIDFFPALPDNIETDVESKYNLSVWHIR